MKIGYKEILKQRDNNRMKGIYLFFGREEYLMRHVLRSIEEDFLEPLGDLNIHRLDGKTLEIREFINACETLPMLRENKLVLVENFPVTRDDVGKRKAFLEDLGNYLAKIGEHALVILISSEEKAFSGKFYRRLNQEGTLVEFAKLNQPALTAFISTLIRSQGKNVSNGLLREMIQNLDYLNRDSEESLYEISHRIESLCRYVGERDIISPKDVEKIMIGDRRRNIFMLLDALTVQDGATALRTYKALRRQQEEWTMVFYMVLRHIRNLIKVKILKERNIPQKKGSRLAGISPYEYNKLYGKVDGLSMKKLMDWHRLCYESEFLWKKQSVNEDLMMEVLLTKICHQ